MHDGIWTCILLRRRRTGWRELLVKSCLVLEVHMRKALGLTRMAIRMEPDLLAVAFLEQLVQLVSPNSEGNVADIRHMVASCL